mgnify:CR=1 FL=1
MPEEILLSQVSEKTDQRLFGGLESVVSFMWPSIISFVSWKKKKKFLGMHLGLGSSGGPASAQKMHTASLDI